MTEHIMELNDLLQKLETSLETGLSSDIVVRNLKRDGLNCFKKNKGKPEFIKFLMQMTNGFGLLLLSGALLCWIVSIVRFVSVKVVSNDEAYLGAALAAVVFISGSFTYYQEAKSSKIMESFKKLIPQEAIVLRDGSKMAINPSQCVVGDIVFLKSGDRIPADVRIVESKGMKVDNSSLTGESDPQSLSVLCTSENPLETKNLGFFPTNVVEGSGIGIVVKVGNNTVMGNIVDLSSRLHHGKTPLAIEIEHFIKIITVVAVFFGLLFFILYMSMGYNWVQSIVYLIAIIVSNVPEGLLCTVTVCLTLTAKKMAKKNCLVKHLQAVETLGSTSVILCDKTGTLTQNRMTVSHVWFDLQTVELNTSENQTCFCENQESLTWEALARIGKLCSRAEFKSDRDNVPIMRKECSGDASEIAILKFLESSVGNVMSTRNKNKKVAEIPFNSDIKYQVSVHEQESMFDHRYLVVMKGAPEKVLEKCSSVMIDGAVEPINEDFIYMFNLAYDNFGGMGERVLGFAHYYLPVDQYPDGYEFNSEEPNFPLTHFCFIGMMSMLDPPRAAVPDAVSKCRSAGIKIIMVTGDHPTTAKAIAKSVGIISEGNVTREDLANKLFISVDQINIDSDKIKACVINGDQLQRMEQHELDSVLKRFPEIVFARISPQLKLIIVEGCQRQGSIVAVTGDGLNDSPALKKADIGIAMGISGSDVSKEAADIILLDDNFASIVTGVEEGRLIFDNLKKSILYTLTSNVPELAPFIIFIILNIPLPLGTVPMLCIAVTNLFPAISLAYERPENDIMERKPRNYNQEQLVNSRLISLSYFMRGVIQSFGAFLCYFIVLGENGFWPSKLIGIRSHWDDIKVNNLEDSYGSEWTYFQRKELEYTVHTAFFTSIVVSQWGDLLASKTRHLSLFQHGMSNWFLNFGLLFEAAMTCFLQYTPGLNNGLNLRPLKFAYWLPTIPFAFIIILVDELRKLHIRCFSEGWIKRETYY